MVPATSQGRRNNPRPLQPGVVTTRVQAGLIEEMLDDAMDALDADELEEEADEEVEKVLTEITSGARVGAHGALMPASTRSSSPSTRCGPRPGGRWRAGILTSNNVPIGKGKERASAADEEDLEADRALAERYAL